jgi:acetolactate synthase-1/2/3 large subunit
MKVSDFIAEYLIKNEIHQCFSVTGGFAMHLNDSFSKKLDIVYTHGEAPAGYSAVGYSKVNQEPCVVCVTAGCGETNAITPCLIAYQDSVPVFFISGGVPHKESIRWKRLEENTFTRIFSGSDHDVVETVKGITKYCEVLWDPNDIKRCMDTCLQNLKSDKPGPVWLSVPLDIQGMNTDCLVEKFQITRTLSCSESFPIQKWVESKRPVILSGNGIYTAKVKSQFERFVNFHKVPVVSTYFSTDITPEHNLGRVGILGDRTGNFTIQNADFILNLGSSISKSVIGYRKDWFAREATIVSVNIETVQVGETIIMDLRDFFDVELPKKDTSEWLKKVFSWKNKWFRELPNPDILSCPYTFMNSFYNSKPNGGICVASSGSIFCVNWHQFLNKGDDQFVASSHGDMGFEIPCSIGCAIQSKKTVYCIVGDGSFQFNFQEIHTIKTLNLPIKIIYFDNGGYGAIKITQDSYFKHRCGVDMECPPVKRICDVYDLKYFSHDQILEMFEYKGPCLINVVCNVQQRYPRLNNTMKADGTFDNKPIEDMWPFLDRDEFNLEMCIKQIN